MTIERIDPPLEADERTMLTTWLDWHRATLLEKCEGLSDEQLRECSVPPSPLSLLGLVRHMAEVERGWFLKGVANEEVEHLWDYEADEDADFHGAATGDVAEAFAALADAVGRARAATEAASLDDTFVRRERTFSLRWVLVHMIEEYARHNGHADFLRERIDGATGY